jgi:hypothetical protein
MKLVGFITEKLSGFITEKLVGFIIEKFLKIFIFLNSYYLHTSVKGYFM